MRPVWRNSGASSQASFLRRQRQEWAHQELQAAAQEQRLLGLQAQWEKRGQHIHQAVESKRSDKMLNEQRKNTMMQRRARLLKLYNDEQDQFEKELLSVDSPSSRRKQHPSHRNSRDALEPRSVRKSNHELEMESQLEERMAKMAVQKQKQLADDELWEKDYQKKVARDEELSKQKMLRTTNMREGLLNQMAERKAAERLEFEESERDYQRRFEEKQRMDELDTDRHRMSTSRNRQSYELMKAHGEWESGRKHSQQAESAATERRFQRDAQQAYLEAEADNVDRLQFQKQKEMDSQQAWSLDRRHKEDERMSTSRAHEMDMKRHMEEDERAHRMRESHRSSLYQDAEQDWIGRQNAKDRRKHEERLRKHQEREETLSQMAMHDSDMRERVKRDQKAKRQYRMDLDKQLEYQQIQKSRSLVDDHQRSPPSSSYLTPPDIYKILSPARKPPAPPRRFPGGAPNSVHSRRSELSNASYVTVPPWEK
eukprot:Platyproteum_vivax@DN3766_c0_g1_i1.p1